MNRLFKNMTSILLAGIILTGCSYDDAVRQLSDSGKDSQRLITFSNSVIDKPVITRAVTLLSDHMYSMGVWGWQTTPFGSVERLFLNQEVTFNVSEAQWTYRPPKYWDYNSTYRFCAYAPHSSSVPGVTASIDSVTQAISIKGVTLQGSNTIDSGVPAPPANFGSVQDIDWMIDRYGQNLPGVTRSLVTFNMQHILSKICVSVRHDDTFPIDTLEYMTLDSLEISNFISQGDFTQCIDNDSIGILREWTPVDTLPRYSINSAHNVSIPDTAVYVMESLLIPQLSDDSQYIRIWYTIGNRSGYKGHFYYIFKLNEVFSRFMGGRNYQLALIIGPQVIKFDSGVSGWDDQYNDSELFNRH